MSNNNIFETNFINVYSKEPFLSKSKAEMMIKNSKDTLKEMMGEDQKPNNKTGLLVGKVQSGKTANFLALISTSFDNGYDIALVFAGKENKLYNQNCDRISELFSKQDILKRDLKPLVKVIKNDKENDDVLKWINNGTKIVIIAMKENVSFDRIQTLLKKNENLVNKKFLIIDDEGDQGTLNANAFYENKNATKWNSEISHIRELIRNYSFITVTATPYANLFIDEKDIFLPKFIKRIIPDENYTGLDAFHSEESNNIIIIPEKDMILGKEHDVRFNQNLSIRKAVSTFLISAALKCIDLKINASEMLIHNSEKKIVHENIKSNIQNIIQLQMDYSKKRSDSIEFKKGYMNFINLGFEKVLNRKANISNKLDKELIKLVTESLPGIEISIINQNYKKNSQIHDDPLTIYIGAAMIERGVTFKNLTTVYMSREAKQANVDTLLQRGRWFGYRRQTIEYIKIFLSDKLKSRFEILRQLEEEMWDELGRLENGEYGSIEEWIKNIHFRLGDRKLQMNLTRKGVSPKMSKGYLKSWFSQTKVKLRSNEFEKNMLQKLKKEAIPLKFGNIKHGLKEFNNISEFELYMGESFESFLDKVNIDKSLWNAYAKNAINTNVNLILMRPDLDEKAYRTVFEENQEINLFAAGSAEYSFSTMDIESKNFYFGDRKIDLYQINANKITILVYSLEIKFVNKNSNLIASWKNEVCYAVHFPKTNHIYAYKKT
ncbi:hypothetical protein CXP39_01920 [Mesoplasma syrphidae]|uniref:Endonuclease Z1 domain-containing protein n=1 Tax=Mesoplasma syrphidae TaxID=225999 RepID=A0A2K9BYV0_9MOLU|nr:Z1 domain-containing protein [Mesoplasma syrphidae]AUF83548.1 hypothetical protein CXP39_01920 [Mesoplasma syrphidae]